MPLGHDRIVAMLTKLGQRGYYAQEEAELYTTGSVDPDSDPDPDPDPADNTDDPP